MSVLTLTDGPQRVLERHAGGPTSQVLLARVMADLDARSEPAARSELEGVCGAAGPAD